MMDDRTPIAQRTAPEKVAANGLLHNNMYVLNTLV